MELKFHALYGLLLDTFIAFLKFLEIQVSHISFAYVVEVVHKI